MLLLLLTVMAAKRIAKELADFDSKSPEGWSVKLVDGNSFHWRAKVIGPPGSPYEAGQFWLDVFLPSDYPFNPPMIRFLTKIYHCNVNDEGQPSHDIWTTDWSPAQTVLTCLRKIVEFMVKPNPDDPMDPSLALRYRHERVSYDETAREWTRLHAKPESTMILTIHASLKDNVLKVRCLNMSGDDAVAVDLNAAQIAELNVSSLQSMILQRVQGDAHLELVLPDGTPLTGLADAIDDELVSRLTSTPSTAVE